MGANPASHISFSLFSVSIEISLSDATYSRRSSIALSIRLRSGPSKFCISITSADLCIAASISVAMRSFFASIDGVSSSPYAGSCCSEVAWEGWPDFWSDFFGDGSPDFWIFDCFEKRTTLGWAGVKAFCSSLLSVCSTRSFWKLIRSVPRTFGSRSWLVEAGVLGELGEDG